MCIRDREENIYADSVRLNQVLLNLLSNALKFTPEGGDITVTVSQEDSPRGERYVRTHFWVKDNGMGMTKEFQKKIFESFVREDNARVRKVEGTGLGMAITKYIVDKYEGTIEVNSELNVGTEQMCIRDSHGTASVLRHLAALDSLLVRPLRRLAAAAVPGARPHDLLRIL